MTNPTVEEKIIELLAEFPEGLKPRDIQQLIDASKGSVSGRLCVMTQYGKLVKRNGVYALANQPAQPSRPREMVETRTEKHDIPEYMRNQSSRNVTMYSITRLADVMQMKLRNGVKQMTVPLIGQSIRIHVGNAAQSWPFSEAFTGYTEIEFRFSNGKSSIIAVASTDVVTIALENGDEHA